MMGKNLKADLRAGLAALDSVAAGTTDDRFARAQRTLAQQPHPASGAAVALVPSVHRAADHEPATQALTTHKIALDLLDENPFNARRHYSPEVVADRAASIAEVGQMTPALVCVNWRQPGRYILIAGHYRRRALLKLGRREIDAKLVPCATDRELFHLSYLENDERKQGTPLDDAFVWSDLLEKGVVKNHDDLAALTRKPRTTIVKTLAVRSLPPNVLGVLSESPESFSLTAAYELSVIAKADVSAIEVERIARKIAAGEMSTRELERVKASLLDNKTRKSRESSRKYTLTTSDGQGTLREFESGRVVLEIDITDPQKRDAFVADLRQRLGGFEPAST